MIHHASANFWKRYRALPQDIRARADKQFSLLKSDLQHPSLRLKRIADQSGHEIWSVRITLKYRALSIRFPDHFRWFWIGEHDEYDQIIS